jgi:hypothetical protein
VEITSQLSSPAAGTQNHLINMKKLAFYMATALLLIFLVPTQVKAGPGADPVTNAAIETVDTDEALAAEAEVLIARLEEINEMDKSDLTRAEKRELRKEVRQIDKTLTLSGGGVYLSVGALILVILLLILLL